MDCNDADPNVHPNATETCNGLDDGDSCTVGDTCSFGTCHAGTTITAPPETQDVAVAADKATFNWSPSTGATHYDLVRGSTEALPVDAGGDVVCFEHLAGTTVSDPEVPAWGAGFWYLSRGENACGIGTFGTSERRVAARHDDLSVIRST